MSAKSGGGGVESRPCVSSNAWTYSQVPAGHSSLSPYLALLTNCSG